MLNSFFSVAADLFFTLNQQTLVQILKNTTRGCKYVDFDISVELC